MIYTIKRHLNAIVSPQGQSGFWRQHFFSFYSFLTLNLICNYFFKNNNKYYYYIILYVPRSNAAAVGIL